MGQTGSFSDKLFLNGTKITYLPQYEEDWDMSSILLEYEEYFKYGITVKEGDTVLDIGANIGLFSLAVYDRCKGNVRIFIYEPIPEIYKMLKQNIELYNPENLIAFPFGVSNQSGVVSFTYYPNAPCLSTYDSKYIDLEIAQVLNDLENNNQSISETFDGFGNAGSDKNIRLKRMRAILELKTLFKEIKVECTVKTLSEIIRENQIQQIDLLKVDVGGSEFDVFSGLDNSDWNRIKQIVVKLPLGGGKLSELKNLLGINGYHNIRIEEQQESIKSMSFVLIYARR
ncbi:MAG TPA: FkbM family methyltransferase [Pseudobacteroides sp.]|uniref:FkbM family methyltransferase n=1 Tax=Pseudobacteroides sp. TaxID=1968840 RepID=UPI002F956BE4